MTARGEERRWLDPESGASGNLRALLESAGDDGGGREQVDRLRGRLGALLGPAFGGDGPAAPSEPGSPPTTPQAAPAPAAAPAPVPNAPPAAAAPSPLGATAVKAAGGKALALKPLLVGLAIGVLGGSAATWQVSSSLHERAAVSSVTAASPGGGRAAPSLLTAGADAAPTAPPAAPATVALNAPPAVARADGAAKGPAETAPLAEPPGQAPAGPLAPLAPVALEAPPATPATPGNDAVVLAPPSAPPGDSPAAPPLALPVPAATDGGSVAARPPIAPEPVAATHPTTPSTPVNEPGRAASPPPAYPLPATPAAAPLGQPATPAAALPGQPATPAAAPPGRPAVADAAPNRPAAPAVVAPGRPPAVAAGSPRPLAPAAAPVGLPAGPGAGLAGFPPPPGAALPGPPRSAVYDGAPATGSAAAAASAVPPLRLVDEVRLLRAAQEALVRSPARAFELTEEHRRRFPGGSLVQEREVFAVEALWRTGRRGVALERAKRFLAAHPDSSHAARLRSLVGVEK